MKSNWIWFPLQFLRQIYLKNVFAVKVGFKATDLKYFFVAVVLEEPEFTEVIENVTVPAGRNVKLACSVKNLGSYKVSKI